ncbi:hypothetical protein [Clostridium paraputrificum]|uniref:Uncharacterized protein n=1 Tax=Clostridium paraputrificum TaxID=29363 RepID=A0A6N3EYM4_9CLOT
MWVKLLKKNAFVLPIFAILFGVSVIAGFQGVRTYIQYRSSLAEYKELEDKIMKPIEITDGVFTPRNVLDIISMTPSLDEIILITEISNKDADVSVQRKLTEEELLAINTSSIVEFSLQTSNMQESLNYLSNQKFAYEFIDVSNNVITMRILVKGE